MEKANDAVRSSHKAIKSNLQIMHRDFGSENCPTCFQQQTAQLFKKQKCVKAHLELNCYPKSNHKGRFTDSHVHVVLERMEELSLESDMQP